MKRSRHPYFKYGKIYVTAGVATFLLIGSVGNQALFFVPISAVQAATVAEPIVTTKDSNGLLSVDPQNTAMKIIDITSANMADYFEVSDKTGNRLPINGNKVDLLTGHEPNIQQWEQGTQLMVAKQQIDFKTDFSLNVTQKIVTDNTMGGPRGWGAGDGISLFFEPLSVADVIKTAKTGSDLGTTGDATAKQAMTSFNVSTNALGILEGVPKGNWTIYQSSNITTHAVDTFFDTGISSIRPKGAFEKTMVLTFDMNYSAATKTIHVNVLDESGTSLREWNYVLPDSWIGQGYTLGVAAATAASQSAYSATFNGYSYVCRSNGI